VRHRPAGRARHPGLNGLNGKDGLAGPSGANGVNGQNGVTTIFTVTRVVMESPKQCSSRRVFTITLPRSYKGMSHVRVQTASTVKTLKINRAKRTITIDLRGLKAGTYGVAIRSKGHKTLKRLYTVCNAGNVTAYNVPPAK
jgi:hypothetical protein